MNQMEAQARTYPFKFLDAYSAEDNHFFFGRDSEVADLYQMVFQSDLILVYGASGTGKTSLIQCGLASKFQSHDWLAINVRRGTGLNVALEKALSDAEGQSQQQDLDWLEEIGRPGKAAATSKIGKQLNAIYLRHFKPIYLIFDQFEELYILGNKAEQAAFFQNVKDILQSGHPVKVIISIREEYLGHLYEFERQVPQLTRKKLRVEAMNLDKVKEVLNGISNHPASLVSLEKGKEDQIAEAIFEKVRDKERTLVIQLPYLQVLLDRLYFRITQDTQRQKSAVFSYQDVASLPDIGDILTFFLGRRVAEAAEELHVDTEHIWAMLSPFVTLEGTKEPVSMAMLHKRLPDVPKEKLKELLQLFIKERIVRYFKDDALYEIAHDALAKKIAEKRSDEEVALLRVKQIITGQIAFTEEARFFSESQLNFIQPFLAKLSLNEKELDLIKKSEELIAQQKQAALAAKEVELQKAHARMARENKLKRWALLGATVSFFIALVALYFYIQTKEAESIALQALDEARDAEHEISLAKQEIDKQNEELEKRNENLQKANEQAYRATIQAEVAYQQLQAQEKAKNKAIQAIVNQKLKEINDLAEAHDYDLASVMLRDVMNASPNHPEIRQVKEKVEVGQVTEDIDSLIKADQLEKAELQLKKYKKRYPRNSDLLDLQEQLNEKK